jgi:maltose alpha-D-glucosyltransferase/alpha-amylase
MKSPWYMNAVFYEVPVRAYYDCNADGIGDLEGLTQKLDYLSDLGIDCIWLNPIYPSPLKDDGYDISNYCAIHPDYGNLDDFAHLVEKAHHRGLHLITDLVVNHTSDLHPWFQAARSDRGSSYRNYYVWSDTDQKFADVRIIFQDTEKSNWAWDAQAGQYYWHRFYSHQPDLNYDNPAVRYEMLNVMKFWLDLGVDGFRVDAVPYLFEREGTSCENLPETHAFLKEMRHFVDANYPDCILLCEANQWPHDVRPYFGRMTEADGNEFHMAFHFPLMPRIFMALKRGETDPIRWVLDNTPDIPPEAQWCTFLRNHDELTLEMVAEEERQWMWQQYASEPRMRLNLGIRRRLAPLLDNDRRLIELANSLLFTLPGAPIIYYGDEIGMGDNIWLPDRNGVRTPMQWDGSTSAGFSQASRLYSPVIDQPLYDYQTVNVAAQQFDPGSLWHTIHKMIQIRKQHPALGEGHLVWVDAGTDSVLAFYRQFDGRAGRDEKIQKVDSPILVIHNLSAAPQAVTLSLPASPAVWTDLLTGISFAGWVDNPGSLSATQNPIRHLQLNLAAHQSLWLE